MSLRAVSASPLKLTGCSGAPEGTQHALQTPGASNEQEASPKSRLGNTKDRDVRILKKERRLRGDVVTQEATDDRPNLV